VPSEPSGGATATPLARRPGSRVEADSDPHHVASLDRHALHDVADDSLCGHAYVVRSRTTSIDWNYTAPYRQCTFPGEPRLKPDIQAGGIPCAYGEHLCSLPPLPC
jgi:hypothetical protein